MIVAEDCAKMKIGCCPSTVQDQSWTVADLPNR